MNTVLCVLDIDEDEQSSDLTVDGEGQLHHTRVTFQPAQRKSLAAVEKMVAKNGGTTFNTLEDVAAFVNGLSYGLSS